MIKFHCKKKLQFHANINIALCLGNYFNSKSTFSNKPLNYYNYF